MKRKLITLLFLFSTLLYADGNSFYVIKVKTCGGNKPYISSEIASDSLKKALQFKNKEEAKKYIKKLSPTLKSKKPRVKQIKE